MRSDPKGIGPILITGRDGHDTVPAIRQGGIMENEKQNKPMISWIFITLMALVTLALYTGIGYMLGYTNGTIIGMRLERSWQSGMDTIGEAIGTELSERRTFLNATDEMAPHLGWCESQMAEYPEWPLALAIAGAETQYCIDGVGEQNNCGGIVSKRIDRMFKAYEIKCDGLEDIAMTLRKPIYEGLGAGQDLATLGRIWCGLGDECKPWPESVRSRLETATGQNIYIKNEPLW